MPRGIPKLGNPGIYKSRQKNSRRQNCGTCQKITIAYYISTLDISYSEKLSYALNHPNYCGDFHCFSDNRLVISFSDDSVLAFTKDECYIADRFARLDVGIKPRNSKRIVNFVE